MSLISHVNLPNYTTLQQDICKWPSQRICISCLCENSKFVSLSSCRHVGFFDFFFKFKVEYQSSVICQQCHYFLKKIDLFKNNIEENLTSLNEQLPNTNQGKKFQNLIFSKTLSVEYNKDEEIKADFFIIDTNTLQDDYTNLATDVKIEHESSDFEIDMPLSEIKEGIKKMKKKKKKTKNKSKEVKQNAGKGKKRLSIDEMCKGKIVIINLNEKEMNEERQMMATKESYLKLPYKCESCITGFDHELTLKDHMEKRHGNSKVGYVCQICKSILSTESSYKEHTKRHTRRYECQTCGKRNSNVYSVIKHYNEQHGHIDTKFTCDECGFTTGSHRSYRYHRDKHKQKQQCSLCDSTFVNAAGLKVHMFTVHKQSARVYSCDICSKVYNAKSGLAAHVAAAHAAPDPSAYCALCRTHYRSANSLAHHLRTHSSHVSDNDKRFVCDECGAKFLVKNSLQEHIDFVHLKSSKHQCAKCAKVFINGSALKRHENYVHKKIRPPRNKICDHCGRGFTTLSILCSHIRTHTGARPLRCARCPAAFAHAAALYTHNKLLHKDRGQNEGRQE